MAAFIAFSDESGAQDPQGSFLVGGYVAGVDTWPYFTRAWQERVLNNAPSIPYLHMIEIRRKRWKRKYGLSDLEAEDKVRSAIDVIATTGGMSAVHSEMRAGDLAEALSVRGVKPHVGMDAPHYHCFVGYARYLLGEVYKRFPEVERVDFVVSRKGKVTDHIKSFHEDLQDLVNQQWPSEVAALVGRLIPDDMEESPPLQAADVFCWHMRRYYESGREDKNLARLCNGNGSMVRHRWRKDELEQLADGLAAIG